MGWDTILCLQEDPLTVWSSLPEALIERAAKADPKSVADIARLRKKYSAAQVSAALDLALARQKAAIKFPQQSARLWGMAQAVEQASSLQSAAHKAARFAAFFKGFSNKSDAGVIADLCCGIGGDALGLANAGGQMIGVELDPVRAWMCEKNTGAAVIKGDVTGDAVLGELDKRREKAGGKFAFHIDPARRTAGGKRLWRLEDVVPGPSVLALLAERYEHGCMKLSPAVNADKSRLV